MPGRFRHVAISIVALFAVLVTGLNGPVLQGAVPTVDGAAVASELAVRVDPPPPPPETSGFDSLFIGHSFFAPVAARMPLHALNAGFGDHQQDSVFAGGANGAPQGLWNIPAKRAEIQAILDGGDVELFGMTYHPDHPTMEGYVNWVEYALARNPATTFFVAIPWLTNPGSMDAATYETTWQGAYDTLAADIIGSLRGAYPGTDFYAIPYGRAAVELYTLFEAGELPDVDALVCCPGDGVFRDGFGHADSILVELASLVWLRAIYGVELSGYDYDPGFDADLLAIADAIMDAHDPRLDAP